MRPNHGMTIRLLSRLFRSLWGLSSDHITRIFPQVAPVDMTLL